MPQRNYRDVHLHLSGGTSPVLLWETIAEAGLKTGAANFGEFLNSIVAPERAKSLDDYLRIVHIVDETQSFPLAIQKSVYNCFVSSYLNGCSSVELRWNCVKRSQGGRIDLDKLIIAARAGMEKAVSTFGMKAGMILCFGRDLNQAENEAIWKMAVRYQGKGIMGIDLAGPEKQPFWKKDSQLLHFYKTARTMKLDTTIHCGETHQDWTEEELAYVIENIRPSRIGHGIQIHRYPSLMKKAVAQGIHFEVCPTSNLTTGAVESPEQYRHIMKIFEQNGLDWSINTDATYMLGTDIHREHQVMEAIRTGNPLPPRHTCSPQNDEINKHHRRNLRSTTRKPRKQK